MPFYLIKGIFKPATGEPDGDTVRFAPYKPETLYKLKQQGWPPNLNLKNGTIPVRYEGIDAMEKAARQPESSDATASNLELLGLDSATAEGPGYILSRHLDDHGRPVSFVFKGDTDLESDGNSLFLTGVQLRSSVNFIQLERGNAYPLFYESLFDELRMELTQATRSARQANVGVWRHDGTNTGVSWFGKSSLGTMPPLYPKLWRRLQSYTREDDFEQFSDTLDYFLNYLELVNDRVLVIPQTHTTGLDNLVVVNGNILQLTVDPVNLVFKNI